MKYLGIIVCVLLSLALGEASYADKEKLATRIERHRVILVQNPYADQVKVNYMCVYLYENPWKGVCEKITDKHPGFYLRKGENLSDIQRIGLIGQNLNNSSHQVECLVHFDHGREAVRRLENWKNYIAQINYVIGDDMVCSLMQESQSSS